MVGAPGRSSDVIDAPAQGIKVRFSAPRFEVDARSNGSPVFGALVELFREEELVASCRTGGDGRTDILVLSGEYLILEVSKSRMRTERRLVKMPDIDDWVLERVDLTQVLENGSLRIHLAAASPKWQRSVRVELYTDEKVSALSIPELSFLFKEQVEPILLNEIPVGNYQLRVVCDGPKGEMYPPVVSAVEIRSSTMAEQKVSLALGGRVCVQLLGREGFAKDVVCTIRDSKGEEVPVLFESSDKITGLTWRDPHRPHPGGIVNSDFVPILSALPPGSYELEIDSEDEWVQEVPFEVIPGELTRVSAKIQ
jgi:hypothetical protein